ncbi:MAG: translation initiation factor SUI1 [Arcobacteraceae bacterium]
MIFEMGAKLESESFDTQKEDKKKPTAQKSIAQKNMTQKEHQLVFTYEKRKGKPVTLVGRFYCEESLKKEVFKLLKKRLACGGAINEEWFELQGDVKEKVKTILEPLGWKFRK